LQNRLRECRQHGARWLVAANLPSLEREPARGVLASLSVIQEGDDFRIYRLDFGQ
jgi:hypothetical protein